MPASLPEKSDLLYRAVYKALLFGMTASNILFAIGLVMAVTVRAPTEAGSTAETLRMAFSPKRLLAGDPTPLLATATVILILTPIMRVAASLAAFAIERDYKFVCVSGFVLLTVLITLWLQR